MTTVNRTKTSECGTRPRKSELLANIILQNTTNRIVVELNHLMFVYLLVTAQRCFLHKSSYFLTPAAEIGRAPPAAVVQESMKEVHLG